MAGSSRAARRQEWSERLKRFERSSSTIARFCAQERVSQQSFYLWRKKLGNRPTPIESRPPFAAVRLTQLASISLRLPNGVELSLPSGDAATLAAAIEAAGRLPAAREGGPASC